MVQAVEGVKRIDVSQLHVKASQHPIMDTVITAEVKGLFIREKLFGKKTLPAMNSMSIETNNGVVYLTGKVVTQQQANTAVSLAKSVEGVKNVESRLKVS
jgi:hyperosmotically inducible protein